MTAPPVTWQTIAAAGDVRFTVDGRDFTIGETTMRTWGPALTSGDLEDIVPGMLPEEQYDAWVDLFWDPGRLFTRDLHSRIADAVIGAASGMPPQACTQLVASAAVHWRDFDGWAAERSLDLLDLPLHRFCNLVYARIVSNLDEKDRISFDADLFAPPPGADPDGEPPPGWDQDQTGQMFTAALAQFTATRGAAAPQVG